MSSHDRRLLPPEHLPDVLWDASFQKLGDSLRGLVKLPNAICEAYGRVVDQRELREMALTRVPGESPVGGLSLEETDLHFAKAFDGSCARVQLALMDPLDCAGAASDALVRMLSGGRITLVDVPSGAGAASLSLLATIASLRAEGVLPRLPLEVQMVGGEISAPARQLAEQMVEAVRPALAAQGITLSASFQPWDVTDDENHADLVESVNIAATTAERVLLVIANFSGFLMRNGKKQAAMPQLRNLMIHCSRKRNYAVWIEPQINEATATGGVFPWLRSLLARCTRFAREDGGSGLDRPTAECSSRFRLPLAPDRSVRVHLSLMPIVLQRDQ